MENFLGALFWVGFCLLIVYKATDPNSWLSSEITVYEASCKDPMHWHFSCPTTVHIYKTSYRAIPEKQIVVAMHNNMFVEKYDQCTVYDKNNWYCLEPNRHVSLRGGELVDSYDDDSDARTRSIINHTEFPKPDQQISRFEYDIRSFSDFLAKRFGSAQ